MSFNTNLVIFRGIWEKQKQEDSRYIQFIEKLITNICQTVWRLFFETVAALYSQHFLATELSNLN